MQKHIDSLVDEKLTLNAVVGTQQGVAEEAHKTATRLQRHFTREVECLRSNLDGAERNRIFLTERLRSLEVSTGLDIQGFQSYSYLNHKLSAVMAFGHFECHCWNFECQLTSTQ